MARRAPSLESHFGIDISPDQPPHDISFPKDFPSQAKIVGWKCFKEPDFQFLWIPLYQLPEDEDDLLHYTYTKAAFCAKCNKWISLGGTIHNAKRHLKKDIGKMPGENVDDISDIIQDSNQHKDIKIIQDKELSTKINQCIVECILIHSLPFSLIEDKHLRKICDLSCRQTVSLYAGSIANHVKTSLKAILKDAEHISLAFDAWTDSQSSKYIGITAQFLHRHRFQQATLAQVPLDVYHCTGEAIGRVLLQVLNDYELPVEKIKVGVTDNGSDMIHSFEFTGLQRFPCVCHCLNVFINAFLDAITSIIQPIISMQSSLSKSTVFHAFVKNPINEVTITQIPSFTKTRWYSMYELLHALDILKDVIKKFKRHKRDNQGQIIQDQYISDEEWAQVETQLDDEVFNVVKDLAPFFEKVKNAYEKLERDEFGVISWVFPAFKGLLHAVEALPSRYKSGIKSYKKLYDNYWLKYKDVWWPLLGAATRLNPSIKITALLFDDQEMDQIVEFIRTHAEDYQPAHSQDEQQEVHESNSDFFDCFMNSQSITSFDTAFDELTSSFHIHSKEDIYHFWETEYQNERYSSIAQVALNILSTMVTSASAERLFSLSKRNMDYNRHNLREERVQDLSLISGNQDQATRIMTLRPIRK